MASNFKTILRDGILSFVRNPLISVTSVIVMSVSLFLVGSVIFLNATSDFMFKKLAKNIDVSVYLVPDASNEDIDRFVEKLKKVDGVVDVNYKDPDKVFSEFVLKNKEDSVMLRSLREFQDNPFGGVVTFKLDDVFKYDVIANEVFNLPEYNKVAEWTNFYENANIIANTNDFILKVRNVVLWAMVLLLVVSVLVTFNMFGLSIYSFKDEIHAKKLIGADYSHLRGPFVVQGIIYGVISGLLASVLLAIVSNIMDDSILSITGGFSVFNYVSANAIEITAILVGFGVAIGVISSFVSVGARSL